MLVPEKFALSHIKKNPLLFYSTLLMGFVNSCASFLLTVSIGEFFTLYYRTGSSKGKLLAWLGFHFTDLQQFYLFFVLVLSIKFFSGIYEKLQTSRIGELFVKDLRERIFSAQLFWPSELLSGNAFGKYLLRYSNDMKAVQQYFSKGIIDGIRQLLFLSMGLFLLAKISWQLTGFLFCLIWLAGISLALAYRFQIPLIRSSRSLRSALLAFVAKSLRGKRKISELEKEPEICNEFNTRSGKLFLANMRSNYIESILDNLSGLFVFSIIGLLLWQMTLPYGKISSGEAVMMILILIMLQGSFKRVLKIPGYFNKGIISLNKIKEILDTSKNKISPDPIPENGRIENLVN